MKRWYPFHVIGAFLGAILLNGCSCPASYRAVPAPRVQSVADVYALSRCQVVHYGTALLGRAGSEEIAQALLKRGAKTQGRLVIRGKEYKGTALNLTNSPEVVRVLAAAGCNPNTPGGEDNSVPLCAALRHGRHDLAVALLQAGADPNMTDSRGKPPLCLAAEMGDANLCRELLLRGANANATCREDGVSPLLSVLKFGGSVESSTEVKQEIVRMLLAAGADPLLHDASGTLPLHVAPACLVPTLLAVGTDVNCRDASGRTPLFYGGSRQRLELLLQHGADINARDFAGNTAFDTVQEAALKSFLLFSGCRSGKSL